MITFLEYYFIVGLLITLIMFYIIKKAYGTIDEGMEALVKYVGEEPNPYYTDKDKIYYLSILVMTFFWPLLLIKLIKSWNT